LSGYQLIDFGDGRKLESLAGYVVDRPSPAADGFRPSAGQSAWLAANARYDTERRNWNIRSPWPENISLDAGSFQLPFRATPFGHIGCFPEQLPNWKWLAETIDQMQSRRTTAESEAGNTPLECLNLFAHTGGSTLAMASRGAAVAHVDAAKPSVSAARQVAAENRLGDAKIRYLVEDAGRFVAREVRRGRKYDVIVLDPPGYGHGTGGKTWRISRDLWPLLSDCLRLLGSTGAAMLVTGHSDSPDQFEIATYLRKQIVAMGSPDEAAIIADRLRIASGRSELTDLAGRHLDTGYYVRVTW
jgi:23S rRNA (cytosine1962-C5)-methyltransferase